MNKTVKNYLTLLNIRPIKDIEAEIRKTYDPNTAADIIKTFNDTTKAAKIFSLDPHAKFEDDDPETFSSDCTASYDAYGDDLKLNIAIASYLWNDFYELCCQWIYNNNTKFGKNILEVGCGIGVMSCFLAKIRPDCNIIAVDRSENSIKVAEQIKALVGVRNITFRYCDISDIDETYDTVLSLRTFHENIGMVLTNNELLSFSNQMGIYLQLYAKYATTVCELVKPNGSLICIERAPNDFSLWGLMSCIAVSGFTIEKIKQLQCLESNLNYSSIFYAMISDKAGDDKDVFKKWASIVFANSNDSAEFTVPQVFYELEQSYGDYVKGYTSYNDNGVYACRQLIYKARIPGAFVFFK